MNIEINDTVWGPNASNLSRAESRQRFSHLFSEKRSSLSSFFPNAKVSSSLQSLKIADDGKERAKLSKFSQKYNAVKVKQIRDAKWGLGMGLSCGSAVRDFRRSGVQMIRQLCKCFQQTTALQVFFRAVDIFESYIRAGGRISTDRLGMLKTAAVCIIISAKVMGVTHAQAIIAKTCSELQLVSKKELVCLESEVLFQIDFSVTRLTISEALAQVLIGFANPELTILFPSLQAQAEHLAFVCTLDGGISPNCNGVLTIVSIVTAAARANYAASSANRIRDDVIKAVNRLLSAQALEEVQLEHVMEKSRQMAGRPQAKLDPWLNREKTNSRLQAKN